MPKQRITSRLANKQKKELTRQSIVLVILSLLIGAVFILVVLPGAVRLFFEILDKQTELGSTEALPLQPPIASPPPEFTNQASLTLQGFADQGSVVHAEINNQVQRKTAVNDQGEFSLEIQLREGENAVGLFATNDQGAESATRIYLVTLDTTPPQIKIGSPDEGARFQTREEQTQVIQGETKPRSRVLINDRLVMADTEGYFSYRYHLSEGENQILIKATDQAGNEAETQLTLYFRD